MPALIVSDHATDWPIDIPNVEVVDAWTYLTEPDFSARRHVKVFNLCRSYKYQSTGYYVSLLAEARGHKPLPGINALQDLKSPAMVRYAAGELEEEIELSLVPIQSDSFTLSIYFGRNLAKRYDRLAKHLFNIFQAPLLRVKFVKNGHWQMRSVKAIATSDVPESHWPFVTEQATRHFSGRSVSKGKSSRMRYDLAILHNPEEGENSPSEPVALKKFIKAAGQLGIAAELITRDDYGSLMEYDALFIRATTFVNHFTYRFAQRAEREGMPVIDSPTSIARCTNKVYLAELLTRQKIPTPRTLVVHKANADEIIPTLGLPCVIKKPDSSFSRGVEKVTTAEELDEKLTEFFAESELLVAQEFLPTTYDWRIGLLDNRPFFACKYYMAPGHWQIIQQEREGRGRYGKSETIPIELAPRKAVQIAQKAAGLIGDGLYGVDVKESDGKFYVIEVNDNPNLDAGCEDSILRDELYRRVMESFLRRIESQKAAISDYR
ncbi:MAG: RimK family protein [Planctomycetaceae bacterium]|nr:RimK family protein [Planctomycetaceae bacterium]